MPTERPQQANLLWLLGGLAILSLIAWRPASGASVVVALTAAGLALTLAHDYWANTLQSWHPLRRAGLVVGCAALGSVAFLAWPIAPVAPAAAVLIMAALLHWQRGRWPNVIDRLTGLPTAQAFAARGEEELSRGLRFGRPAVVAVVAIDNANDILAFHGREALDRALRRIAETLRQHSRGYDLLGRLDDTRFTLLLPETSQDEATSVIERIKAAIEQIQSVPGDGGASIYLAPAVGLAVHPRGGDSIRALVNRADDATRTAPPAFSANGYAAAPSGSVSVREQGQEAQAPTNPNVAINAPIAFRRFVAPSWAVPGYIALVWLIMATLFVATFSFNPAPSWSAYLTLLLISILGRHSRIPLYGRGAISFQFVPLIAASLLFAPTYAFLLGAATVALVTWRKGFRWQGYAFDIGQFALISGVLALAAPQVEVIWPTWLPSQAMLIPHGLILGALCYMLNAVLLVAVMSLHEGASPLTIWRERMGWFLPYTLAFGLLAVFMAWAGRAFGPLGIVIFAIPAFMLHLVTKQYVDRTKEHVTALREAHDRLAGLNRDLMASVAAVEHSYSATLSAFSGMLDARDSETEGHSQRVVAYALAIGQALCLSARDLAAIEVGALLHDIGKVGIPDAILRKPGKLDPLEWEEMKRHPEIGYQLTSRIPFLDAASPLVLHHHERWDGEGYPSGLRGEDIPLAARIFAVADAYDALVSDRPYRSGRSHEQALEEIRRYAGTQFDPQIVTTFLQITTGTDWATQAIQNNAGNTIHVSQLIAR
ncbi:MAG: diguanylate cyclase [Chloroflexia bacterium]